MGEVREVMGDRDIRPLLRRWILAQHQDSAGPVIIEELGLCRGLVRVDLVAVDRLLHGYEIKSDRDSLRRLPSQAAIYNRVLDEVTLVVSRRHLDRALGVIPPWWGVLLLPTGAGEGELLPHRPARRNPAKDPRALAELLWYDDALDLLERRRLARGVRGKPRRALWNRISAHLPPAEITAEVCARLRARAAGRGSPSPP